MFFNMTTKFYCEKSCINNHKDELSRFGQKAYIVTGKNSSKQNGSLKDITDALSSIGSSYLIYDKIEENPSVECVMDSVAFARDFAPDYVIGIGGGSPLDASKAIALMLANSDKGIELLTDGKIKKNEALDVICVPTTCGTGSEVTPYSILTFHDKKTKSSIPHLIFPKVSFADPTYLKTAPDHVLKNTAVDALGHFIESYVNTRATKLSRMFCEKGLSMWHDIYSSLIKNTKTYEDYENLMLAAALSGIAISHTSTTLPHGMSYFLTYEHGIAHGKAVGMFLASYLEQADDITKKEVLNLLKYNNATELHDDIRTIVGDVTITKKQLDTYSGKIMENTKKLKACPFYVNIDIIKKIFSESLSVH